jgi:hypothetical protein
MDEERELNEFLRVLDVSCSCRNVEWEAWHKLVSSVVRSDASEESTEGDDSRSGSDVNGLIRESIVTRSSSASPFVVVVDMA